MAAAAAAHIPSNSWLLPLLCNEVPHCRGPQPTLISGAMAELDRNVYPDMKEIRGRKHLSGSTTSCKGWAFRLLLIDYYVRHSDGSRLDVFPHAPSAHGVESNFTPEALKWLMVAYATLDNSVWNKVDALGFNHRLGPQNEVQAELLHRGRFGPIPLYNLFGLSMVAPVMGPVPITNAGIKDAILAKVSPGLTLYTMCVVNNDWGSRMEPGVVDHVFTFIISSEEGVLSSYINSSYGAGCLKQSQTTRPITLDELIRFANVISQGGADGKAAYADMFFPSPYQSEGDSDDETGPLEHLIPKEAGSVVVQRPVILWMQNVSQLIEFACGNVSDFKDLIVRSGLVNGDESGKIPLGSFGGGKRTRQRRRRRRQSRSRTLRRNKSRLKSKRNRRNNKRTRRMM